MTKIILIAILAFGAYAYSQAPRHQQVIEPVLNADGTPSKYTLMRLGPELHIWAEHKMGDGSIRRTVMSDLDADGKVDIAYVSGKETDNEAMFYTRNAGGKKFAATWQEEWDESYFRIEEIRGRPIR